MKIVLEQRQMLKMVMTTELRQAIELLQLSTYELMQFIQKQAEENPFIELIERDKFQNSYQKRTQTGSHVNPIDFASSNETTLHDQLLEQIIAFDLDKTLNQLVHYLILNIDERGYLIISDEEVCNHFKTNMEKVEKAKSIVHQLEPTGIGASDLSECLQMQANKIYPNNDLLASVIDSRLQDLADKRWEKVAKEHHISLAKVKEVFDTIQTFNPRPATYFSNTKVNYVNPDIFIERHPKNDTLFISLNDYYLPEIRYNNHYSNEMLNKQNLEQYVKGQYRKFEWLIKSIEQRRTTILKIMEVIVNHQQAFLNEGSPSSLKALTLRDVAEKIGMHESTVSRATANKIVQTPVGTFELRYLFSTSLSPKSGANTSQMKVKTIMQKIIDTENKYKPLSDQRIADQLKREKGISISRRTVAKYRDELQIPSSSKRREIKIYPD